MTSVFKSGSKFFTIPASCIRKPLDRISSMEVISPAATFFPRIVFGIHGAYSRGFLGGLLPVLRPANLPRCAVDGDVGGDCDLVWLICFLPHYQSKILHF